MLHEACGYRSVVMAEAVQQTSHTYNWFFLFYRFVVGVLFAQLTVGILIATFGEASRLDTSATGEVLNEFKSELKVLSNEEQVAFVKELGVPAQFSLDTASAATTVSTPRSVELTPRPALGSRNHLLETECNET